MTTLNRVGRLVSLIRPGISARASEQNFNCQNGLCEFKTPASLIDLGIETMSPVGNKLLLVLVILLPFSSQQSCDSFRGTKELDYALPGHTFHCSTTSDLSSCALRCLSHDRCKSCNYALSGPQRGLCELNSEGRHASTPLQYRPGFVFVQAIHKQVGLSLLYFVARRGSSTPHIS